MGVSWPGCLSSNNHIQRPSTSSRFNLFTLLPLRARMGTGMVAGARFDGGCARLVCVPLGWCGLGRMVGARSECARSYAALGSCAPGRTVLGRCALWCGMVGARSDGVCARLVCVPRGRCGLGWKLRSVGMCASSDGVPFSDGARSVGWGVRSGGMRSHGECSGARVVGGSRLGRCALPERRGVVRPACAAK